ncbi:hypothetical protein [Paraburkholderia sp. BR14374]|uniref:hypothetical protein n=1 Tax=Paraburkholderia sp. BR14374 TaxID=3237007 RepID=UPI0034CD2A4B
MTLKHELRRAIAWPFIRSGPAAKKAQASKSLGQATLRQRRFLQKEERNARTGGTLAAHGCGALD